MIPFIDDIRAIARKLGRTPSTISRELRHNAATRGSLDYRASTRNGVPTGRQNGRGRVSWRPTRCCATMCRRAPKGTDLSRRTIGELEAVAHTMKTRPRKTLGWKTPAEVLDQFLAEQYEPSVATTG